MCAMLMDALWCRKFAICFLSCSTNLPFPQYLDGLLICWYENVFDVMIMQGVMS